MNRITENRYYDVLRRVYFDDRLENAGSEYFRRWVRHKYTHSIEVAKAGLEIMNNDSELRQLSEKDKERFVSALLMHDAARPKEIDNLTGKKISLDHGVEAAMDMVSSGEDDLSILIPVMIHGKFNENLLTLNDDELEDWYEYKNLTPRYREFVKNLRKCFYNCGKDEQKLINDGIYLVKDADKIANILEDRRMLSLEKLPKVLKINPVNAEALFEGRLVKNYDRKTYADVILSLGAWFNDLRYQYTKKLFVKHNVMQKLKNHVIEIHPEASEEQKAEAIRLFDKAIEFVKRKSDEENFGK